MAETFCFLHWCPQNPPPPPKSVRGRSDGSAGEAALRSLQEEGVGFGVGGCVGGVGAVLVEWEEVEVAKLWWDQSPSCRVNGGPCIPAASWDLGLGSALLPPGWFLSSGLEF